MLNIVYKYKKILIGALLACTVSLTFSANTTENNNIQNIKNFFAVDNRTSKELGRIVSIDRDEFMNKLLTIESDKNKTFLEKEKEISNIRKKQEEKFLESEKLRVELEKKNAIEKEKARLLLEKNKIDKEIADENERQKAKQEANELLEKNKQINILKKIEKEKEIQLENNNLVPLNVSKENKANIVPSNKDFEIEIKKLKEDIAEQRKEMEITKKMLEKFKKSQDVKEKHISPVDDNKTKIKIF